jgi:hypothetical protein
MKNENQDEACPTARVPRLDYFWSSEISPYTPVGHNRRAASTTRSRLGRSGPAHALVFAYVSLSQ